MSASFLWNLCLSLRSSGMSKFAVTSSYVKGPTAADVGVLYLYCTESLRCPPVCLLNGNSWMFFSKIFCPFMLTFLLTFWILLYTFPRSHPLRQQALLAAISEKDANIALLELSSSKRKKAQEEVMALKREKDRLMHQLKQQVHPPRTTTKLFMCAYKLWIKFTALLV